MRRPGPNHHGEIAEGFYIVVDGRVHLSDELGKAIPGFSDVVGIDPLNRARKLLRGKAMQNRPDEFWRMSPRHGGWWNGRRRVDGSTAEEGPGRKRILDRGLAFSRGSRGRWGNATHNYKAKGHAIRRKRPR